MLLVDCTSNLICILFVLFYSGMNLLGYLEKKAWFNLTSVIVNVTLIIIHFGMKRDFWYSDFAFNMNFDMFCLAFNVPLLVIVDEIETRRSVIKSVFVNKYKKGK